MSDWQPPGKDCGACGAKSCSDFLVLLEKGTKSNDDCPFYGSTTVASTPGTPSRPGTDVCGRAYDFIIGPLPGEPSARKIILPFRADLVERAQDQRHPLLDVAELLECQEAGAEYGRQRPVAEKQTAALHLVVQLRL